MAPIATWINTKLKAQKLLSAFPLPHLLPLSFYCIYIPPSYSLHTPGQLFSRALVFVVSSAWGVLPLYTYIHAVDAVPH